MDGACLIAFAMLKQTASFACPSVGDAETQILTRPFVTSILLWLLLGVTRTGSSQLAADSSDIPFNDPKDRSYTDIPLIPIEHRLELVFKPFPLATKSLDVPSHFADLLL